jgi:NADH:ubiquinone oxidoreductase subunit F (NADH-binding)
LSPPPTTERLIGARTESLAEHHELHGTLPRLGRHGGPELIESVARAGLRGRGGAAFPSATKMSAVADSGRAAIVVANAAEGEPASAKDRVLLERAPQLVLDGTLLAAEAVGADEVVLCIRSEALAARESVEAALAERLVAQEVSATVHLVATPNSYLAGEESALVRFLNGGPAKPTFVPPRPFERGVSRRPTLVQNVETLAHLALIARHGPDWFRRLGTPREPGTALVTLSGAVAEPGVHEIPFGTALRDLLVSAGGATDSIRAVLIGGYFGSWVDIDVARPLLLHDEHLRPLGGGLGSGAIVLLGDSACPVAESARVAAYLAREAAGQCGPCTHGLGAVAAAFESIADGNAHGGVADDLERWSLIVPGRGACHHPDGAIRFVRSALDVFASEFEDHLRRGRCDRCDGPPVLPIPPPATTLRLR